MIKGGDFRTLIHTPQDCGLEFIEYHRDVMSLAGVETGIKMVDDAMIPMKPGDVIGVIARPGHGKSTFMAYLTRKIARDLMTQKREKEVAVFISYEQSIEEIESYFQLPANDEYNLTDISRGRIGIDTLMRNGAKRAELPVWMLGNSITRRKTTPRMTFDKVIESLEYMEREWQQKPALICLDYVQIIPIEKSAERVQQVTEAIMQTKELAKRFGCPIIVGVQARRDVDEKKNKLPGAGDCQWASAIEQVSDKLFSLWRPILTEEEGSIVGKLNGSNVLATPTLLVAKLLKQRFGPAGQIFNLYFSPEYLRLEEMSFDALNL
jgi:replicative DNA helicase